MGDNKRRSLVAWGKKGIFLLGFLLLGGLVTNSDPAKLWEHYLRLDPLFYLAAFGLSLLGTFFRAERWRVLVGKKVMMPYGMTVLWYFAGYFWGALTPGRVAELYRVRWLSGRTTNFAEAAASVLYDRFFDVLAMAFAAGCCFLLLGGTVWSIHVSEERIVPLLLVVAGVGTLLFVGCLMARVRVWVWAGFRSAGQILHALAQVSRNRLFAAALWTAGAMALFLADRFLIAVAVGIEAPVVYVFAAVLLGALFSLLPITIQGVGTRDLVFVSLLGTVGIPQEQALVFSSAILSIILLHAAIGYCATLVLGRQESFGGRG